MTSTNKTAEQIVVAIYARASSDEQTASCGDQLKLLRTEAKKRGYQIVQEYVDDGLSGSREIEKRVAFHALVADSYKREFSRVLVYDTSRFGRLDSQAAGEYKMKLRKNGVTTLESLAEGVIDWSTQMGRLTDALMSEANYEAALKISRSSIRGRTAQLLDRHILPHSQIPYGFDRLYKGDGQEILISRGARFRMPRTWTRTLVINDKEAEVVRAVFDRFVNKAQSMRQIAKYLDRQGVPGWNQKGWSWDSIRKILSTKAYLGYGVILDKKKTREAHNRMTPTEVPNVLPVILTGPEGEQLWHDAQRLLKKTAVSRFRSDKDNRTLGGILKCGHCGYALVSRQRKHESGNHGPVFYACISGLKRSNTGCPQWRAYESEVLPAVVNSTARVSSFSIS